MDNPVPKYAPSDPTHAPSDEVRSVESSRDDGLVSDWALDALARQQVDRDLAAAGRCGLIDPRTGFVCAGVHDHGGPCQFVDSRTAAAVLEHYQHEST